MNRFNDDILRPLGQVLKPLLLFLVFAVTFPVFGQELVNWKDNFVSPRYGYSIIVPNTFTKYEPTQKNTDLAFEDDYGSSISINITDRLQEEYKISSHSYTKEMMEEGMRQGCPNYTITRCEKILIDNAKVFLICNYGEHPKLSSMKAFFYYKDKAYLVNCTTETNRFEAYKTLFQNVIMSIKFERK